MISHLPCFLFRCNMRGLHLGCLLVLLCHIALALGFRYGSRGGQWSFHEVSIPQEFSSFCQLYVLNGSSHFASIEWSSLRWIKYGVAALRQNGHWQSIACTFKSWLILMTDNEVGCSSKKWGWISPSWMSVLLLFYIHSLRRSLWSLVHTPVNFIWLPFWPLLGNFQTQFTIAIIRAVLEPKAFCHSISFCFAYSVGWKDCPREFFPLVKGNQSPTDSLLPMPTSKAIANHVLALTCKWEFLRIKCPRSCPMIWSSCGLAICFLSFFVFPYSEIWIWEACKNWIPWFLCAYVSSDTKLWVWRKLMHC